jgi:hypothetical protein
MSEEMKVPKHWEVKRLGKMWQLFGDTSENIISELNEALAA